MFIQSGTSISTRGSSNKLTQGLKVLRDKKEHFENDLAQFYVPHLLLSFQIEFYKLHKNERNQKKLFWILVLKDKTVEYLNERNIKVLTFWEAHKISCNLTHAFDIYLVNVKSMRKIFSNLVCFSESPNFNYRRKNILFLACSKAKTLSLSLKFLSWCKSL